MGKPLEVVIINDFAFPSDGASRVAIESALGLAKRGHQVHFFAGTGEEDPRLVAMGIRVSTSNARTYPSQGLAGARASLWDTTTAARFNDFVADVKGAVAHVHSHRDAVSPSVLSACIRMFPTVLTAHDYALGCPYGCFYDFQKGSLCGQRGMSLGCMIQHCNRKSMLHKVLALARHAKEHRRGRLGDLAAVIFVSEFSQRILSPYSGSTKQYVIANPISVEPNDPLPPGERHGFVYVGAVTEGKGVCVAAQAARQSNLPLTFIGDGDSRQGLNEDGHVVRCLGSLPRAEMLDIVRRSRALVFPVLWLETQGMVVAEALANGVPVIATSHSAAVEFVRDRVNGLLVPGGNVDALAEAMRHLNDPTVSHQMGMQGYEQYWSAPLTLERHLDHLEPIYRELATS